jgi:transposase
LRDRQEAGVWDRLHQTLLDRLGEADRIDCAGPPSTRPAFPLRGGEATGPNPTNRGKQGSRRHLVVDRAGIPLAITLSAASVHDCRMLETTVDAIAAITRPGGQRRKRPSKLHAAKVCDCPFCRDLLRRQHIILRIASKGIERRDRLGRHRWVVERTLAWLDRYRRLTVRFERRADIHQAFLALGCALICWNSLA